MAKSSEKQRLSTPFPPRPSLPSASWRNIPAHTSGHSHPPYLPKFLIKKNVESWRFNTIEGEITWDHVKSCLGLEMEKSCEKWPRIKFLAPEVACQGMKPSETSSVHHPFIIPSAPSASIGPSPRHTEQWLPCFDWANPPGSQGVVWYGVVWREKRDLQKVCCAILRKKPGRWVFPKIGVPPNHTF